MNGDWEAAYWRDMKYPAGIGGRSHVKGTRGPAGEVVAIRRHIRKLKNPTVRQIETVIRLHQVSVTAKRV